MQRGGAGAAQYGRDTSQQLRTLVVAAALHGVAGSRRTLSGGVVWAAFAHVGLLATDFGGRG